MFENAKSFIEKQKRKIVASALALVTVSVVYAGAFVRVAASATTDTLNETFLMLGGMIDGFALLIPSIVNLIIAMIPLIFIGVIISVIVGVLVIIPTLIPRIGVGKKP